VFVAIATYLKPSKRLKAKVTIGPKRREAKII